MSPDSRTFGDRRPPGPGSGRPATRLVGRRTQLDVLARLLGPGGPGVVNVTGTPGVGKSVLVRTAVAAVQDGFGEVQRLDLAGETVDSAVATVRRHVLQTPVHVGVGVAGDAGWRRSLLVLDRADVLVPAAREIVDLAAEHAGPTIVVESVQELRTPGCGLVFVTPLGVEDAAVVFRWTADGLGVALGRDPVTDARVARVCAAVDGNPLAVELAAGRLATMSLTGLEAMLSTPGRAVSVLVSPTAGDEAIPGVRSVGRTRSSTDARTLLDTFSVFSGSFSIDAAEAVSDGIVSPCWDALAELVDLRLVEPDPGSDGDRFRLTRLVGGHASSRLEGTPLEAEVRARHATHFCGLARRAARAVEDADEDTARLVLGDDFGNAMEALSWLTDVDPPAAVRLAADLGWEAHRRGTTTPVATVLERLLARVPSLDRPDRRDALLWLVQLHGWAPDASDRSAATHDRLAEALDLARGLDEPLPLLQALRTQFLAAAGVADVATARGACEEGITTAAALGHPRWLGRFEISLSSVHSQLRDGDRAAVLATSGLARAQRSGDRRAVVSATMVLHSLPADVLPAGGPSPPALEDVLATTRELGDIQNETHVLATLAQREIERGDHRAAAAWVLTRQEHLGRSDLLYGLTVSITLAVHVARLAGDANMAARLHGSVAAHAQTILPMAAPAHAERYERAITSLGHALGPDAFDAEVARGAGLDRDAAMLAMMVYLQGIVDVASASPSPTVPPSGAASTLTPREHEVLQLLARGLRNKEIAEELHLSPKTVMHHTVAIYRKLGVRGRAEAAVTAARDGLVVLG